MKCVKDFRMEVIRVFVMLDSLVSVFESSENINNPVPNSIIIINFLENTRTDWFKIVFLQLDRNTELQSRPKVVRHLSCITYPPSPLINVGKYRVFSNKKGKNHLIINIESGGRGELTSCPNSFVWDCLKQEFKECHTIFALAKVGNEESCTVSRVQLTRATREKQHAMASFTLVGTRKRKVIFLSDLLRQAIDKSAPQPSVACQGANDPLARP